MAQPDGRADRDPEVVLLEGRLDVPARAERCGSPCGAEYVRMNGREQAWAAADGWLAGTLTRRQALRRLLGLGLTVSSASAFLAACSSASTGSGGGQAQTSTKPSVTIGIVQEPTSLDPTAQATASISLLL